jgi:hypothetical protein
MGYSSYKKIKQVADKFGLKTYKANFFTQIALISPSDWLQKCVELAYSVPLSNEKVKSERLISPVLTEVHQLHKSKINLYSGEELNISPAEELNGACDFFFSATPDAYLLSAPIVVLAEAKDEDMEYGIAQCTAQMIGAQRFNEMEGKPLPTIWGCATTAGEWKFLKLEQTNLYIDEKSYYIDHLDVLLGVFHQIIDNF